MPLEKVAKKNPSKQEPIFLIHHADGSVTSEGFSLTSPCIVRPATPEERSIYEQEM